MAKKGSNEVARVAIPLTSLVELVSILTAYNSELISRLEHNRSVLENLLGQVRNV